MPYGAFYFDQQRRLNKERIKNLKNNSGYCAPSTSFSPDSDGLEDLGNRFQYLKKMRSFLKLDFPRDIASLISEYISDEDSISGLLNYIVEGEQDKAEVLVSICPELLLKKGRVEDLSRREFKDITAFQYALWALDYYMWKMLLKYMSKKAAALQCLELEEKGTAHGKHFSLIPLIEALNVYAKNYDRWSYVRCEQHWNQVVGKSQLLLPVHVVNEYCHPGRPFYPCPTFDEETLPRGRQCTAGEWFTCEYKGGKLGDKFSIFRYNGGHAKVGGRGGYGFVRLFHSDYISRSEAEALQRLWQMRHLQLEYLKSELSAHISPRVHL